MNLTSQAIANPKIKYTSGVCLQPIISSTTRVRLCEDRACLNKIKPLEKISFIVNDVSFNMINCPTGDFLKGSDDPKDYNPQKLESIEHSFLLGETEVTQELYESVMGVNPSEWAHFGPSKPVHKVTWYDSITFCNRLSKMLRKTPYYFISEITYSELEDGSEDMWAKIEFNQNANGFRLPTAREWEYAAKAWTNNKWAGCDNFDDLKNYAWLGNNSSDRLRDVKTRKPNEWGFYDMTGNVEEWCEDAAGNYKKIESGEYVPGNRSTKGGSWSDKTHSKDRISWTKTSADHSSNANRCGNNVGFRIAANI